MSFLNSLLKKLQDKDRIEEGREAITEFIHAILKIRAKGAKRVIIRKP
jgi:hypothetical protein